MTPFRQLGRLRGSTTDRQYSLPVASPAPSAFPTTATAPATIDPESPAPDVFFPVNPYSGLSAFATSFLSGKNLR